jgi:hypothetical protein
MPKLSTQVGRVVDNPRAGRKDTRSPMRNYVSFATNRYSYRHVGDTKDTVIVFPGRNQDEADAIGQIWFNGNKPFKSMSASQPTLYILLDKDHLYYALWSALSSIATIETLGKVLIYQELLQGGITITKDDLYSWESPRKTWSHGE